jgi:hypothetical protein
VIAAQPEPASVHHSCAWWRRFRSDLDQAADAETRAAIEELRGIPQEGVDCDAAAAVWEEALRGAHNARHVIRAVLDEG